MSARNVENCQNKKINIQTKIQVWLTAQTFQHICVCTCVLCMYVCMYACVYVCVHVCVLCVLNAVLEVTRARLIVIRWNFIFNFLSFYFIRITYSLMTMMIMVYFISYLYHSDLVCLLRVVEFRPLCCGELPIRVDSSKIKSSDGWRIAQVWYKEEGS